MRRPLLCGNWKMFKTVHEAVYYVRQLLPLVTEVSHIEIVVAPPFTAIWAAADAARNSNVAVAAQDVHWEREGAFTGEVSAAMLREAGAQYAIVGHSERRTLFGETNQIVNKKVLAVLGADLTPIMCIGETLAERERDETNGVLDRQVEQGLEGVSAEQIGGLVIAYEPVWAIGTGRNATPQQAQRAHVHIRHRLEEWFGSDASKACRIIYGGSVKPDNTGPITAEPDIDGALVGGACLDVRSFVQIIQETITT
ncbi:MAG: triose-phosphate isomerase [Vicinamibacterales bacterium]